MKRGNNLKVGVAFAVTLAIVSITVRYCAFRTKNVSAPSSKHTVDRLIPEKKPYISQSGQEVLVTNSDPHAGMYKTPGGAWYPKGEPSLPFYTHRHAVVTNYGRRARGPKIGKNRTENALLNLFTRQLGDMPPVAFHLTEQERQNLVMVLISKNKPTDEDCEKTKLAKEVLQSAKDEMRTYIKEGGDPQLFFDHYRGKLKNAFDTRVQAQRMISAAIKEGTEPDAVSELAANLNKVLVEKGIKPVHYTIRNDQ